MNRGDYAMTEKDIIMEKFPQIVEMTKIAASFTEEEFEKWRKKSLDTIDGHARLFMEKVFNLIKIALT